MLFSTEAGGGVEAVHARPSRRGVPHAVVAVLVVLLVASASYGVLQATPWLDGAVPASSSRAADDFRPRIVSERDLRTFGDEHGPVYWAGPRDGREYELTPSPSGAAYVRYLPEGVGAGSPERYLTVATYRQPDGGSALGAAVAEDGLTSWTTGSGALVAVTAGSPSSTYFSFPGAAFQVETFSPVEGEAHELVMDGSVQLLRSAA